MEAAVIVIAVFAGLTALFVGPFYVYFTNKTRERLSMQDLIRRTYEAGQPITPDLIESMNRRQKVPPTPFSDIRSGIIWLSIAVGLGLVGWSASMQFEVSEPFEILQAFAMLPGFIGIVMIGLGIARNFAERKPRG